MAVMVIGQLAIGVVMVVSLAYYPLLLAIHRPLGILIGVFAVIRLVNRLRHHPPAFEATMSPLERRFATWSERLLYALLLVQPLVGWAMVSAANSPVTLVGSMRLPGIAPFDVTVFATLRWTHLVLATLLFVTFTAHMLAVLFHKLVLGDGVLQRMSLWPARNARGS